MVDLVGKRGEGGTQPPSPLILLRDLAIGRCV